MNGCCVTWACVAARAFLLRLVGTEQVCAARVPRPWLLRFRRIGVMQVGACDAALTTASSRGRGADALTRRFLYFAAWAWYYLSSARACAAALVASSRGRDAGARGVASSASPRTRCCANVKGCVRGPSKPRSRVFSLAANRRPPVMRWRRCSRQSLGVPTFSEAKGITRVALCVGPWSVSSSTMLYVQSKQILMQCNV